MQVQSKVCADVGSDARAPLDHRHCTGAVLVFAPDGDLLERVPCCCVCHIKPVVVEPAVVAEVADPAAVLCDGCGALLEDGSADSDSEEDPEEVWRMDRRFARTVNGQTLCPRCHWSMYVASTRRW